MANDYEYLAELFTVRTEVEPERAQYWASLAFVYYQLEEMDAAIETLEAASAAIPSFTNRANCYIENIEAGNDPAAGC